MRGGWGRKAARCGLPRFLRPLGRSQCLREGALGRAVHAALCSMPRFLRPSGRSQRLRGGVRWGVRGMLRFAACRVSCGLRAARNACAVRGGVRYMPRFAACRVSCGLWVARNACFLCCGTGIWGAAPNPGKARREACALWALGPKAQSDPKRGSETMSATVREARMIEQPGRPLHPALLSPYLTTRFLSLCISSVTPSGGSPNVALSVLLPPSHVSCIAISRASIRQPSSTTVTTSPTS